MNCIVLGGGILGVLCVGPRHLPWGGLRITASTIRMAGVRTDSRTGRLPNTDQKFYRWEGPVCLVVMETK
jgi:hypothetical protein